ncbi:hypothetical protein MKX08_003392 [Trichoderma sp. CBMAI-0020]|nr:hypothetical protein MKX08_003392 [Trichoderma sp. CBMAI-0020]
MTWALYIKVCNVTFSGHPNDDNRTNYLDMCQASNPESKSVATWLYGKYPGLGREERAEARSAWCFDS